MKRWIALLLAGLLLAGLTAPVLAQEPETSNSHATVEFEAGEGPTDPVDPENPGNPGPDPEPVDGSLAIVRVTDLAFVRSGISTQNETTPLLLTDESGTALQPHLQVVDLRGSGTGWRISVSVSPFTSTEDGTQSLQGARLLFHGARFNSTSSDELMPAAASPEVATNGVEYPLINAAAGKGTGLWVARWYPETDQDNPLVELWIPAGQGILGGHSAEITWTLYDTP